MTALSSAMGLPRLACAWSSPSPRAADAPAAFRGREYGCLLNVCLGDSGVARGGADDVNSTSTPVVASVGSRAREGQELADCSRPHGGAAPRAAHRVEAR
jgi:hypothetical protein